MKHILKFFLGAVIASASIGAAQAADQTYKTTDGGMFSLNNVYRIDPAINGFIRVVYINGGDTLHADSNGSVFNTIKMNNPNLVQISGTQSLVNPNYVARGLCQSGWSRLAMQGSSVIVEANDSCTMANQAIAKAK